MNIRTITRASVVRLVVLTLIFVFATAFAPLIGVDQRNYLVIFFSILSVPLIMFLRFRLKKELLLVIAALVYPWLVTLFKGTLGDLTTTGYTTLLATGYLAVVGGLRSGHIELESVRKLLKGLIFLYALVSVLQLLTSFAGLPVLNLILSKGVWSYNSLAVEPSHAGRAMAMTMLTYLMLSREWGDRAQFLNIFRKHGRTVGAFVVSIGLTGSATGVIAAPLAILLALSKRWIFVLSGLLLMAWPMLYLIDSPVVRRALMFMTAVPTMNITAIVAADQSGALRVLPVLLYLDKASIGDVNFWLGGGPGAISAYVKGELVGAGDLVAAGFIPGYLISYGVVGTLFFLYAFVFRFLTAFVLPIVVLWLFLFGVTAWNTQLFWFGLILLRVAHHFRHPHAAQRFVPPLRFQEFHNFYRTDRGG
jgi:hypothetical protein